jgi:HPr kinase/phosphorylase
MPESSEAGYVHATAIALDGAAVLIEGMSGSGKSRLAAELIFHAHEAGRAALLVGDDRVRLVRIAGEVRVAGHPDIAGRIEIRGHGILGWPHLAEAPLRWRILISGNGERLPERPHSRSDVMGVLFDTFHVSSGQVTAAALLAQMLHPATFARCL